ncbi:MAG TPA: hypothetical protein VNM67_07195 [Thermoanaerobaculia bacterium]|nr:hypothetical protein [Thermoanaerobaculia bacterium]
MLVSSLLAKLEEWPFLVPLYHELLGLVAESRAIVLQQESARALFHEAIGRRKDLESRGVELRTRIASHLKAQLGFRNEQLRMFGLNPLPRVTRRKTEEEPEIEITAPSETPAE